MVLLVSQYVIFWLSRHSLENKCSARLIIFLSFEIVVPEFTDEVVVIAVSAKR